MIISAKSLNEASEIGESIARSRQVTTGGKKTTCAAVRELPEGRSIHWFPPGV